MRVELVLTAHPTEVIRRTLIQKYDAIDECLTAIESSEDYPERGARAQGRLEELISRAGTPTRFATNAPPRWMRPSGALRSSRTPCGRRCPIFTATWIACCWKRQASACRWTRRPFATPHGWGRSRRQPQCHGEGDPEVLLLGRWMAADLYLRDLEQLKTELSMWKANSALKAEVGDVAEPYRELLKRLLTKMEATRDWAKAQLEGRNYDGGPIIETRDQLYAPLLACYRSLCDVGLDTIANGALLDTLRRVAVFGVTLTKLDLRQEAGRHAQVMEELTSARALAIIRSGASPSARSSCFPSWPRAVH